MKNPIPHTGWFITPKSQEHLIELCQSMSNASEAQRMMVFTFNYCHKLVNEMLNPDVAESDIERLIREIYIETDVKEMRKKFIRLEQLMRL